MSEGRSLDVATGSRRRSDHLKLVRARYRELQKLWERKQPELAGWRGGALNQAVGMKKRGGAEGVGGSGETA